METCNSRVFLQNFVPVDNFNTSIPVDNFKEKVIFVTGMPFFLLLPPENEFLWKF